jgi:hypothetical protein
MADKPLAFSALRGKTGENDPSEIRGESVDFDGIPWSSGEVFSTPGTAVKLSKI